LQARFQCLASGKTTTQRSNRNWFLLLPQFSQQSASVRMVGLNLEFRKDRSLTVFPASKLEETPCPQLMQTLPLRLRRRHPVETGQRVFPSTLFEVLKAA
jgi:hypothetical protein